MSNHEMAATPVCSWIPVTDASGRTSMEARWTIVAAATAGAVRSAA